MNSIDEHLSLFQFLLAEHCTGEVALRRHMEATRSLRMDGLDYCAHQFGMGNRLVWQKAASWAGYQFSADLPSRGALPYRTIDDIDHLGERRSLRQSVLGKEITFIAPSFDQVVELKRSHTYGLVDHIRFAPPDAIEVGAARGASEQLIDYARQRTSELWPRASAALDLPLHSRILFVIILGGIVLMVMLAGVISRHILLPIVAVVLMAPGLLRLVAAFPRHAPQLPPPVPDALLPIYTVLIPLRDESQMVPLLKRAMSAIDYPSHRLDIKFVVEAKSPETVRAVEKVLGDPRFRMVVVPQGAPHTKPKALNYALPLARGEYLVVYDAEDVPETDQLRLAAARFAADPELACLQAELVPENAHENVLTALFAGEYAGLFGRLLPALARWRLPIPLGGTSNHFRTSVLRDLGGWDAFNVTEDADLGVRLARRGLRADAFTSRTYEEAPLTLHAWMAQRTRWMKGWMQTFIVHGRSPLHLLRDTGWRGVVGFYVLIGGMIVSSILHTVFIGMLVGRLVVEGAIGLIPFDMWDWFAVGILASGYGGAIAVVVSGLIHQRAYHLIPMQIALPFYWGLHSVAAIYAARELILRPVHWAKTTHGVTRVERGSASLEGRAVFRPRNG